MVAQTLCLTLALLCSLASLHAQAGKVLILSTSVSGGASSIEAQAATAAGHTPEVVSPEQWSALTKDDFAAYDALVLGDASCSGSVSSIAAAEATKDVWSPAVTGNVIIDGTDAVFHRKPFLTHGAVAFAAAEPGATGLYTSLSCYYHGAAPSTHVPVLSGFGDFTVTGVGCFNDAHRVADHSSLAGVTDETLSNWGCSVHEAFDSFPSTFMPLAIAKGATGKGVMSFADGTSGLPYILARGKSLVPVACGDGKLDKSEECDDGNSDNGDGCSAQCKIEPLPPVELTCPAAHALNTAVDTCTGAVDVSTLVTVSEGAELSVVPEGPYPAGTTDVVVTATRGKTTKMCTIPVTVSDVTPPTIGKVTPDTTALWPPNHKMVLVKLDYTPTDNCGESGAAPKCELINPTSSEPASAKGDNNTDVDIKVTPGDATNVLVRAERSGTGTGRAYNVTVKCVDAAGNEATAPVTIAAVPKSQGSKS